MRQFIKIDDNYRKNRLMAESPCNRQCCLDENDYCVGCFRRLDEITNWTRMTNEQQLTVIENCDLRKINHTNNVTLAVETKGEN